MVIARSHREALTRVLCLATLLVAHPAAASVCDDNPIAFPSATDAEYSFSAADLVALRDIGNPDSSRLGPPSPLAVDPTGRYVALVLTGADTVMNQHCRWLVAIDLATARAIVLDKGGDFIGESVNRAGVMIASGTPSLIVPQWSPDGRHIAYRRRDRGVTQIWMASLNNGNAHSATASHRDIVSFRWHDARTIMYEQRAAGTERPSEEANRGYLYDHRFVPTTSALPQIAASDKYESFRLTIGSDLIEPLGHAVRSAAPSENSGAAPWRGELAPLAPSPLSPSRVTAVAPDGTIKTCLAKHCEGQFTGIWSVGDNRSVAFIRREGSAEDRLALYLWVPGERSPHRILATEDTLIGCTPAPGALLCLREHATRTRHLVRIDLPTGAIREIYDPNPQSRHWRFGSVQRLYWKNAFGLRAYGDLVLPPGAAPAKRLPLVIVQYNSVGFLRGGTGDEYPIHLLAKHGFAVLSVQKPPFVAASKPELTTALEINAFNLKDWGERRSLLSSLEAAIEKVVALGIVDPERIGITGLSDGATTARFGLINGNLFAAAAVSSCCIDPSNMMTLNGPSYAALVREIGYPPATEPDDAFWMPVSLALNAEHIDAPLLMQLSDDEYLLALESYTALREHGKPVELYIFSGEHHVKTQPAHRLAIYRRSIQWFAFWLQDRELPEPVDADQYTRWQEMRVGQTASRSNPTVP